MLPSDSSKFIVADDHPLFREALMHAIRNCVPGSVVHQADSLASLYEVVEAHADADLLFLDLHMPGVRGFSALAYMRIYHESLPTVIVSAADDPAVIRRAIQYGASGFIPKSSHIRTIEAAIDAIVQGEVWLPDNVELGAEGLDNEEARIATAMGALTRQQFRVLMLLGEGLLNKQIAHQLGVTERTIKTHMSAILSKLQVGNRTQAVLAVRRLSTKEPGLAE